MIPRLDELNEEAEREIAEEKLAKKQPRSMGTARTEQQHHAQHEEERDFIELGGMPSYTVAEIHCPGEGAGRAVRVIVQPSEKTADASHRNAEDQGEHVRVPRALSNPKAFLGQLDAHPAAEEPADDRLSADPGAQ